MMTFYFRTSSDVASLVKGDAMRQLTGLRNLPNVTTTPYVTSGLLTHESVRRKSVNPLNR